MRSVHECSYKGHAITTRWTESNLPQPDSACVYAVSFSVRTDAHPNTCWQEFLTVLFASSDEALAFALRAAMVSIDSKPADDGHLHLSLS